MAAWDLNVYINFQQPCCMDVHFVESVSAALVP